MGWFDPAKNGGWQAEAGDVYDNGIFQYSTDPNSHGYDPNWQNRKKPQQSSSVFAPVPSNPDPWTTNQSQPDLPSMDLSRMAWPDTSMPDVWSTGGNSDPFSAITHLYEQILGRDPENQDVVSNWWEGTGHDLGKVQQGIFNSEEAQNRRNSQSEPSATVSTGTPSNMQRVLDALASVQSTDDPNYWYQHISADPNGFGSAWNYWLDRIRRGDGSALVQNGSLSRFNDGPTGGVGSGIGGGNQSGYTDPNSLTYLNAIMDRLAQLRQPVHDPAMDQLNALIQQRLAQLSQPPYTNADDAALIAKYRQPLVQARDAALAQANEDISRRGYLPSSGLAAKTKNDIRSAYVKGVAAASNNLATSAIDQRNANANQQLAILNSLVQLNRQNRTEQNGLNDQAVATAAMLPAFDNQRLSQLLQASGGDISPASLISGLTGLGSLNLNASNINNANSQASSQAWGQLLGYLMGLL